MTRSEPLDRMLEALGLRVRALRESRGWTRRVLAQRAGISERYLAGLELGGGNISVLRLAGLARALAVSPAALLESLAEPGSTVERPGVVALLGLRGAGKTTIGRALGKRLGLGFFELDQLVEQAAGMPTGPIFELHGERWFRRLERETLARFLVENREAVLATGGGLVAESETYDLLLRNARTVWLKARPREHWDRVVAQGDRRPMHNRAQAMQELEALLAGREGLYARAEITADTSQRDVAGTVEAIAHALARTRDPATVRTPHAQ